MMRKTVFAATAIVLTQVSALSLEQALDYTLENSPDIQISLSDRTIRQMDLTKKLGAFLPTVDGNMELVHDTYRQIGTSTDPTTNLWRKNYSINAVQNVFDGMQRYHDYKSAERTLNAFTQGTKDQSLNKMLEVGQSYMKVMLAEQLVELSKSNFKRLKELADLIDKRVAEGVSKQIDSVQAKSRVSTARANLLEALGQLYKNRAEFKMTTGGLSPIELETPDFSNLMPKNYEEFWQSVQENGAKLKQYAYLKDSAYYEYQATKSAFMPTVNAIARYEIRQNVDGNTNKQFNGQLGMNINYNVFRGSQDFQTMYAQAQKYQQARFEFKRQTNSLEFDVMSSWEDYNVTKDALAFYIDHATASESITKAYKDQFVLGQRTLLDVLDSYNELYRSVSVKLQQEAQIKLHQLKIATLNGQLSKIPHHKMKDKIFLSPQQEKKLANTFITLEGMGLS